jgi:hypothetical protein
MYIIINSNVLCVQDCNLVTAALQRLLICSAFCSVRSLLFFFSHLAVILELYLEMLTPQSLKTLVNPPTYQIGLVVSMVQRVYHSPRMFLLMAFWSKSNIVIHVCCIAHQGAPIAQYATTVWSVSIITALG